MKKQYWVNLLTIIFSFLLISCASLKQNNETIVNTALNLANKQIELNNLEDALNTYNRALNEGNDYRLLYNKAIVQAKLGNFKDAAITSSLGYKLYPAKTEFLKSLAVYYYQDKQFEKFIEAYEKYINLNSKDLDSKITYLKLCYEADLIDKSYDLALSMWEAGIDKKDVVDVLYAINPEEWEVVKKVIR